ncbi:UDP-glucuronosyltransferase 2C1-like [Diadema antillarum]|uniref:UDP-glucuronosyltransferase 2C1-like n=1 Tax=Diadema antillarum TaxID=105358 RepID=UPI003A843921
MRFLSHNVSFSKPWLTSVIFVTVLYALVPASSGANILLARTSLFSMPSHYMGLSHVTQALIERGHHVTLLLMDKIGTKGFVPNSYSSNITYPNSKTDEQMKIINDFKATGAASMASMSLTEMLRDERLRLAWDMRTFGCFELFKHEGTLKRLKHADIDLVLTSPVVDACDAVIAAYLDVPFVVVLGVRRTPVWHEGAMGIPTPLSYVPFSFLLPQLSDQMSFIERLLNVVASNTVQPFFDYILAYRPIAQMQTMYGIRPDLSPRDFMARAALWLCHSTVALEYPRPTSPNWIDITGATIKDPKPLPKDLDEFVEGSKEHGFILFTLGSMTVSLNNQPLTDAISKVLSELPQRIIWRYIGPKPRYLGNNTLIVDWLPQRDLLAHPGARLLIYHGGAGGVHEAIHCGVPMLIMPLAGDQPVNAHLVAAKGLGLTLNLGDLDEEKFRQTVHEILETRSYKENAMRASAIFRDRMASPLDTAVFWIEHVLKFGGDHLRLRAAEMGFIQLHSLDVIAFLIVVVVAWLYLSYVLLAACYRRLCKMKSHKAKTD